MLTESGKAKVAEEISRLAEELEDVGIDLAMDAPMGDRQMLAVVAAGYLLRVVGNDLGAIVAYDEEDLLDEDVNRMLGDLKGFVAKWLGSPAEA